MKSSRSKYFLVVVLCLTLMAFMIVSVNAMELVSVDENGNQADEASYENASLSLDGNIIAFASSAGNLVKNDTNGASDIFVRNRTAGTVQRISIGTGVIEANGASYDPSISGDGRYVVFTSEANNLVANDTNGVSDVFLYDGDSGTTLRISVGEKGNQANGASYEPVISGDGNYVAFTSEASNLVYGDINDVSDIFIYNVQQRTITIVSNQGAIGDGASSQPAISGDGTYVAFTSKATNFGSGESGFDGITTNVFLYDAGSEYTILVSGNFNNNEAGNGSSYEPSLGPKEHYMIAFTSEATNLLEKFDDTNNASDIFIFDVSTSEMKMISVLSDGTQGDGASRQPSISGNLSLVAFTSAASNFGYDDNNAADDIYLKNLIDGSIKLVSANLKGSAGNKDSTSPAISGYGNVIAFTSGADDLVEKDVNYFNDVFAQDLYKTDMAIKGGKYRQYIGQDIYNNDGTDQTISQNGISKRPVMYLFRVYNKGFYSEKFKITGPASSGGWDVKYYIFGSTTDVTAQVTGYGWVTPSLAPGGTTGIYAMVTPTANAAAGSSNTLYVKAVSQNDPAISDTVKAVTEYPAYAKPDFLIKASTDTDYIGYGIINNDGTGQTKSLDVLANRNAMYLFRVYNTGNANDAIKIQGPGSLGGWTVNYYLFGTTNNITDYVVKDGYSLNLNAGDTSGVYALVRPNSTVPVNETFTLNMTATSEYDNNKLDVVKAVTTRK